jgi:thymidine kinase
MELIENLKNTESTGYLELILGPMFSGKTTQIIQIYKKYTYIGKKVSVINYYADTRYDDSMLSTHDKIMIPCIQSPNISQLWNDPENSYNKQVRDSDVILINEGQFFEDLYDCVLEMVEKYNKIVYICGLDGDFKRNIFGKILNLIPYCDKITKLQSLCSNCKNGNVAIFSHRITTESSQIVIGSDNYVPLCRMCYLQNNK